MIKTSFINGEQALYTDKELSFVQEMLLSTGYLADPTTGTAMFQISENSPNAHSVKISAGKILSDFTKGGYTWKVIAENTAESVLAVPQNTSGSTKYAHIVLKVDNTVDPNAVKSNVTSLQVVVLATATPTDADILGVIGSGMNFYRLGYITQVNNNTVITNAMITNVSTKVNLSQAIQINGDKLIYPSGFYSGASYPSTPYLGQMFYKTTAPIGMQFWNGSTWNVVLDTSATPDEATYTAGEAIAVGNAFTIGTGAPIVSNLYEQTANNQTVGASVFGLGYNGVQNRTAQTFVAGRNGIKSVTFQIGCSSVNTGANILEIYATSAGVPTGSPIWTQTTASLSQNSAFVTYTFTLATQPTLTEGTTYAFAVKGNGNNFAVMSGMSVDMVAGSVAYTTTNGTTWTAQAGDTFLTITEELATIAGRAYLASADTVKTDTVAGIAKTAGTTGNSFIGYISGVAQGLSFAQPTETVTETIDQQAIGGGDVTNNMYVGSTGISQFFRTGDVANMTKIGFELQKVNAGGGNITVTINDPLTGLTIGTGTIADGVVTTTRAFYDCTFSTPLVVKPNTMYQVSISSDAGNNSTNYYTVWFNSSDVYAFGYALYFNGSTTAWSPTIDLRFKTKYTQKVNWTKGDTIYLGKKGVLQFSASNSLAKMVGIILSTTSVQITDVAQKGNLLMIVDRANFGDVTPISGGFSIAVPKRAKSVSAVYNSTGDYQSYRFGKTVTSVSGGSTTFNDSNSSVTVQFSSATPYKLYIYD